MSRGRAQESESKPAKAVRRPETAVPARTVAPVAARALAVQRVAGNRAAGRVLARWIRHPDEEQKGVMVPDVAAAEFLHFNPPKNA